MGIVDEHLTAARRRIRVCYALVVGENLFELLWPFAIGLAIDGLIDDSWAGVGVFVALSLAHTAVAFVRQRHQSRTFNPLHAGIAADLVEQQRGAGIDMASVAACGQEPAASSRSSGVFWNTRSFETSGTPRRMAVAAIQRSASPSRWLSAWPARWHATRSSA
jgi:hypothetical protein